MRIAVVGTGTDVGKTYVGCALARALVAQGVAVRALKPIESGLGAEGVAADARALAQAAGHDAVSPRYGFERAVSPHLEARRMGITVSRAEVVSWLDAQSYGMTIVETAGGLLSPLGVGVTNLDLVGWVDPGRVVVVAADRLGVLHDVAAVRGVLEGAGYWGMATVVLSTVGVADASTGTNAAELVTLGVVGRVVTVEAGGGLREADVAVVLGG